MVAPKKKVRRAKTDHPRKAVKVNPVEEYRQAISSTGVVSVLSLVDDDCLSTCRNYVGTQSVVLDHLLGGRGIPCGRIIEIYGPPHSGKSTILDHIFAQVQKDRGVAILADTEASRDVVYVRRLGVDPDALQYLEFEGQPTMEVVLDSIERTVKWWKEHSPETPVVIGWDSLGSTPTANELSKAYGEPKSPGEAARTLRKAFRQVPAALGGSNVALVICNHEYQVVSASRGFGGGVKRETYGGDALRHAASVRMKIWIEGYLLGPGGIPIGREIHVKVEKNRLGPSPVEGQLAIVNSLGINNVVPILNWLKGAGRIAQAGGWMTIQGTGNAQLDGRKFQGWYQFTDMCMKEAGVFEALITSYKKEMATIPSWMTTMQRAPAADTESENFFPEVEGGADAAG